MKPKVSLERDLELTTNSPDDQRLKKSWGYLSALPSEYLIHFHKGKLQQKTSGQGATCFKHLRDTVFIVPTSLKEIIFEANQLTVDNVDVKIRGMALYRISDPLKIYKLINFSNRSNAEEKLARMIGDMCRSTSKWLVANMHVDECIRKRKEEIAESLRNEMSRIVADDERGWGVEIITIDIQDVYIQDNEIFTAMQTVFKAEKIRASKTVALENERNLELKKIEMERSLAEHRKNTNLEKAQIEAEIANEKIRLSRENEEKQFNLDQYRIEQNEKMTNYKLEQQINRDRLNATLLLEQTEKEVAAKKMVHQEEIEALEKKIQVENETSRMSLEKAFIEQALPSIAEVVAKSMNNVKMSIYQQDGNPTTPFKFVLNEILEIFKDRVDLMGNVTGSNVQNAKNKE